MAATKAPGSRERCAAREIPSPNVLAVPVALGRVLRSCLTESQLPFLCISGQKLDKSWILRWKLEEDVRQLQVPALSQPNAHIMLPKNCLATTPPPQNVILLLLLQHNRRKKKDKYTFKLETIPLSETVLQPLKDTQCYKWKFLLVTYLTWSLKNKYLMYFLWPLSCRIFLTAVCKLI